MGTCHAVMQPGVPLAIKYSAVRSIGSYKHAFFWTSRGCGVKGSTRRVRAASGSGGGSTPANVASASQHAAVPPGTHEEVEYETVYETVTVTESEDAEEVATAGTTHAHKVSGGCQLPHVLSMLFCHASLCYSAMLRCGCVATMHYSCCHCRTMLMLGTGRTGACMRACICISAAYALLLYPILT